MVSMSKRLILPAILAVAVVVVFVFRHNDTPDQVRNPPVTASGPAGADASSQATGPSPARTVAGQTTAVAGSASEAAALPRLVDVGADRCVPCKAMAPILESLRRDYAGRLRVDFIDAWKHPEQAVPFKVYGIPTQIFFDPSGRELYRHLGFFSKEDILSTWHILGYPLTPLDESRP